MVDFVTVDPSILKGIETPYDRDAKLAAINQMNQNTNNLVTANDTAANALYQSQSDFESTNAMRKAIRDNPDLVNDPKFLAGLGGYKGGSEYMKARAETSKLRADAAKVSTENDKSLIDISKTLMSNYSATPEGFSQGIEAMWKNPDLSAVLVKNGATREQMLQTLHDVSQKGQEAFNSYRTQALTDYPKILELAQQKYATDTSAKTALMGQLSTATTAANQHAVEREKMQFENNPYLMQDKQTATERGKLIGTLGGPAAIRAKQQADIENTNVTLGQISDLVGRPAVKDAQGNIISPEIPPHPGAKILGNVLWLKLADSSLPSEAKDFKRRAEQLAANAAMVKASIQAASTGRPNKAEFDEIEKAASRIKTDGTASEFVKSISEYEADLKRFKTATVRGNDALLGVGEAGAGTYQSGSIVPSFTAASVRQAQHVPLPSGIPGMPTPMSGNTNALMPTPMPHATPLPPNMLMPVMTGASGGQPLMPPSAPMPGTSAPAAPAQHNSVKSATAYTPSQLSSALSMYLPKK